MILWQICLTEIGIIFTNEQHSYVDPIQGSLKFSSGLSSNAESLMSDKIKSITYETNFSNEYVSSDTGISNVLNILNSKSWSLTAKTPFIIKDSIFSNPKYSNYQNGVFVDPSAQIAVTIELNDFYKIGRARIFSNNFSNLLLCQVIVETQSAPLSSNSSIKSTKTALMRETKTLKNVLDFDFDQSQLIKSITFIVAQRSYVRKKINAVQSEVNSKIISTIVKEIRNNKKAEHDSLQDYVIRFFLNDTNNAYILRNKKIYSYNYSQYYPSPLSKTNFGVVEALDYNKYYSDLDSFNKFKNTSLLSNIIFSIVSYTLGAKLKNSTSSTYIESNLIDKVKSIKSFASAGFIPLGDSNMVDNNMHFYDQAIGTITKQDAIDVLSATEELNQYEYNFSFGNLALYEVIENKTIQPSSVLKSIFMSKRIPLNGRPLKVKMLAEYFADAFKQNQNNPKTSVEYSVSISSLPKTESDWIPILPYNEDMVENELLIFNNSSSNLRFSPLPESVLLYENGVQLDRSKYTVLGKLISVTPYDQTKTYYVKYTPQNIDQQKEIELHSKYLSTPVLVTPSYNGSNGEYFPAGRRHRVVLKNDPFVDYSKFQNASYSSFVGTIPSSSTTSGSYNYSSYSPLKIIFDDGSTAINITNYILDNYKTESFYETDEILFIHSGDTIIFNKEVFSGFRVLYQYVPDSFRFRVIMRSLDKTPQNYSVDRLIFKFSSEKRDQLMINLIKHDNIFKNKVN